MEGSNLNEDIESDILNKKDTEPGKCEVHYFSIEDTSEGCYRDITSSLINRGLVQHPYKRSSRLPKRRCVNYFKAVIVLFKFKSFRLPRRNEAPFIDFLWTINEKDLCFSELDDSQIVNHFAGITNLTTKMGFCDIIRDMAWICENPDEISPRWVATRFFLEFSN